MKRKLKIYLPLLGSIIVAVCIAVVVVYGKGMVSHEVDNRMEVPAVDGQIEEVFKASETIKINTPIRKEIGVKNQGTTGMFVRVMVLPEISKDGVLLPTSFGKSGSSAVVQADIDPYGKSASPPVTNWLDGGDGYYYYTNRLDPGETNLPQSGVTNPKDAPLFAYIQLNSSLGSEYKDATFTMQVKVETVSSADLKYRSVWWGLAENMAPAPAALQAVDSALQAAKG